MPVSASHQIPWDAYETWARAQWTHVHGPETGTHVHYKDMAATSGYGPHRLIKAKRTGTIPLYAVRDYARGLGIDPATVGGAFFHAADGVTVRPELPDGERLEQLVRLLGEPPA